MWRKALGNLLALAMVLGGASPAAAAEEVVGTISPSSPVSRYVDVAEPGPVSVALSWLEPGVQVNLSLRGKGGVVVASVTGDAGELLLDHDVETTGRYRIYATARGETPYTLNYSVPQPPATEPPSEGDPDPTDPTDPTDPEPPAAEPPTMIDPIVATGQVTKQVSRYIELDGPGTMTAVLDWTDPAADLYLSFRGPGGVVLAEARTTNRPEWITAQVESAGKYRFYITTKRTTDYTLSHEFESRAPSAPGLEVPAAMAFGEQTVGASTTLPLRLTNPDATDAVDVTALEGLGGTDFSADVDLPVVVPAGSSVDLSLVFTPSAQGPHAATLVVRGAGTAALGQVSLSGEGAAAAPPGDPLLEGYAFEPGSGTPATYTVDGDSITVSLPPGEMKTSISSLTSVDGSAGVSFPVEPDMDVAVSLATSVKGSYTLGYELLVTGEGSDALRWSQYGIPTTTNMYAYGRARGGEQAILPATKTAGGHPEQTGNFFSWMRVRHDAQSDEWSLYLSHDGATWYEAAHSTLPLSPSRMKVGVSNRQDRVPAALEIARVVDLRAAGTTDARRFLTHVTRSPLATTGFDELPTWLTDDSAGGGSVEVQDGGLVLTDRYAEPTGTRARVLYTGEACVGDCGLLVRARAEGTGTRNTTFANVGLGSPASTDSEHDEYVRTNSCMAEFNGSHGVLRAFRVDRPPYMRDPLKLPPPAYYNRYDVWHEGVVDDYDHRSENWWRVERVGDTVRMRTWPVGSPEPSSWLWAGDDPLLGAELVPVITFAHREKGTFLPDEARLFVDDLEFYSVTR